MLKIVFDERAKDNELVRVSVDQFLTLVPTLESSHQLPIFIFQDGASGAYYIKCSLLAQNAADLCDLDAKLDLENPETYRANRELLLTNRTYLKMVSDAVNGREFNDIIVEHNTEYNPVKPLKVWGGQHRVNAIAQSTVRGKNNRYHGFRIYFNLTKSQRTEVALISNTNISVSNDTFDRMIEETKFGNKLLKWCQLVGFLSGNEDFPDVGSRSEKISVKRARSFVVNYYLGKQRGEQLSPDELDKNIYEPYLVQTGTAGGISVDPTYEIKMSENDILDDSALILAGERFRALHNAQYRAIIEPSSGVKNTKAFRNKAFVESVLCGWSYVAGLLQNHPERLENHYRIPKTTKAVPDPLNAEEMSKYKHDSDDPTYRGLGTRSALKDRQRIAQLFLAKSLEKSIVIDKRLMDRAVSTVVGLISLSKGYIIECSLIEII
jgi:hypothetical protein